MSSVILVTGGTGLVGKGIEYVINNEPEGSRYGKRSGETWIFASSSEADLRWEATNLIVEAVPNALMRCTETRSKQANSLRNTNRPMLSIWLPWVHPAMFSLAHPVSLTCLLLVGGLFKNMKYKVSTFSVLSLFLLW